jgi:hypothetical protein
MGYDVMIPRRRSRRRRPNTWAQRRWLPQGAGWRGHGRGTHERDGDAAGVHVGEAVEHCASAKHTERSPSQPLVRPWGQAW